MPFPGSSWYARARRAPDDAPQHMPRLCCEYGNVALPLRPALGDDVPVPGTGLALQLLLQRQQLERGEGRNQGRRIAIEMRVPALLGPVADKGVGGDGAASSVIDVAGRQHRALEECLGLQHPLVLKPKRKLHFLVRGRARPVGLQPTDLIRGHPRTAAGVLPASMDTRHKAGHGRLRVVRVHYLIESDHQISASRRPTSPKVPWWITFHDSTKSKLPSSNGSASAVPWRTPNEMPRARAVSRTTARPFALPSIASTASPCSASNNACRPTPQPWSSAVRAPRAFSSGRSAMTSGSGSSQSARPSAVAHRLSQASIAVPNAVAITILPHRRLSALP